jgi:hypothetical protein
MYCLVACGCRRIYSSHEGCKLCWVLSKSPVIRSLYRRMRCTPSTLLLLCNTQLCCCTAPTETLARPLTLLLLLLLLLQATRGEWPHLLFRESAATHPTDRANQRCLEAPGAAICHMHFLTKLSVAARACRTRNCWRDMV